MMKKQRQRIFNAILVTVLLGSFLGVGVTNAASHSNTKKKTTETSDITRVKGTLVSEVDKVMTIKSDTGETKVYLSDTTKLLSAENKKVELGDFMIGDHLVAEGLKRSDGGIDAQWVKNTSLQEGKMFHVNGYIDGVNTEESRLTVWIGQELATILVSEDTRIMKAGIGKTTLATYEVGDRVRARGTWKKEEGENVFSAKILISLRASGHKEITGSGTLWVRGSGNVVLSGNGTLSGTTSKETVVIITDYAGDVKVSAKGFGKKKIDDRRTMLRGTGSLTVTGSDVVIRATGHGIEFTVSGTGSVVLEGRGHYSVAKSKSKPIPRVGVVVNVQAATGS